MKRTDIHRPSAINPTEYQFVSFHSHKDEDAGAAIFEQAAFRKHMAAHPGARFSDHSHGGSCHVCGAHASTVARFYHAPTNRYVETGEDCAEKLHEGDPLNFRSFRKKIKAGMEAAAGKAKAITTLKAEGLERITEIVATDWADDEWEETTIRDIHNKLVRYGSISDKQMNFLRTLLSKIDGRAEVEAQRAAENAAAKPIPATDDRIEITGEILSIKWKESQYGGALKMVLKSDDGWKVYGTCPAAIDTAAVGDRVTFTAKITIADDDPKFGFFKRPTKPALMEKA